MKKWIPIAVLLLNLLFLLPAAIHWIPKPSLSVDTVTINRLLHSIKEDWPDCDSEKYRESLYPFSILDHGGQILLKSHQESPVSYEDAIVNSDLILPLKLSGMNNTSLLIRTNTNQQMKKSRFGLLCFAVFLAVFWSVLLFVLICLVNRFFLLPFQRLRHFASQVAQGNLDLPLKMDSGQIFGAFTESFDLMRDKLAEAKMAEAAANQSKKELIAALSHDIKTPVTSIKLISEIMQLDAADNSLVKLQTIYEKADQIDKLVSNLFQSAMEDLGELKVNITEAESSLLPKLFQNVNYYGRLSSNQCPGCLLKIDPLRLSQVIDNIVNNSYKYAGTDIFVDYEPADEFLEVSIRDYGSGCDPEDLVHLTDKFFRSQTAINSKKDGSGLGLYIAHRLMERMNGELSCHNLADGFCVVLLIPLC